MSTLEVINQKHISLNDVLKEIRKESDSQDPVLRELELDGMLRICDLLSQTGLIRIPGIVYGGLLAERDRVAAVAAKLCNQLESDLQSIGPQN